MLSQNNLNEYSPITQMYGLEIILAKGRSSPLNLRIHVFYKFTFIPSDTSKQQLNMLKQRISFMSKKFWAQKRLNNTILYTQLVNFPNDDFSAKVAHNETEACQLIEAGFEFVCDFGGNKLFRKRK